MNRKQKAKESAYYKAPKYGKREKTVPVCPVPLRELSMVEQIKAYVRNSGDDFRENILMCELHIRTLASFNVQSDITWDVPCLSDR